MAQLPVNHLSVAWKPFLCSGARLTAYELVHDNLPGTLIADSAAAALMAAGKVDAVITGADRVTANGDTANKIGTYSLAVNAARHGWALFLPTVGQLWECHVIKYPKTLYFLFTHLIWHLIPRVKILPILFIESWEDSLHIKRSSCKKMRINR